MRTRKKELGESEDQMRSRRNKTTRSSGCPGSISNSGPNRRSLTTNGNSEGAGLGLAIAERAVNVHRGMIRAINAPNGGLIVEIELSLI